MKQSIGLVFLTAGTLFCQSTSIFAIRNARIIPVSGPVIQKGTVVVRDGLIESVGTGVTPPADAWVIDGEGLTVYPGLIDSLSNWGLPQVAPPGQRSGGRGPAPGPAPTPGPPAQAPQQPPPARGPEDRPSNTSWVQAADIAQTSDRRIEAARNAGFTSAVSFPARGIFAGQGAVLNMAGEKQGQMVVASPAGLYLSLTTAGFSSYPGSLMGVIAYIRQIYLDADHYQKSKEAYARNAIGMKRPEYDRALEGVLSAPRVLLPATRMVEMDRMIRFARELKTPVILYGGHEGYRAADLLKKSDATILVNLRWPERARDGDPDDVPTYRQLEIWENAPSTPSALAKAGVRFALYSGGIENPRDVIRAVKKAMDAGLSAEQALRAMTLAPAEIYGVADRLGSIERGKIANLVVTSGDLFQESTRVKYVFVDGVKFEPAPEQPVQTEEATR
jgi:imidazolonepropionase-like amidohydrolase